MRKKRSGILLHITSLPSPYGIGDFGSAAYSFVDFLIQAGQTYWQILPLNRPNPASGGSPYFSISAFAMNPLLISPESLLNEHLLTKKDLGVIPKTEADKVDFKKIEEYKYGVLNIAYVNFKQKGDKEEFEKFCTDEKSWLEEYALFIALKEKFHGEVWSNWPEKIKNRDLACLEEEKKELEKEITREKFFQYILFKQWNDLKAYCNQNGIKIIGDVPIYVSYDSADVWANDKIFKLDDNKKPYVVSGVPPDYFSETGQLWSNPVYQWDTLKESKYSWWIKRLGHTFRFFDVVRVDHFRGLVQYWEVPSCEPTAINGSWQDVPAYDFFDTLIEHFEKFPIIAEDLGIITQDVRDVMEHYKFPGMKIFQFAFGEDNAEHPYLPNNYGSNCAAYTGTHDNNTLVGWLENEADEGQKERLLRCLGMDDTTREITWQIIKVIMASLANIVIFPMQDILELGASARMNNPGTGEGNWRWRLVPQQIKPIHAEKLLNLTKTFDRTNTVLKQQYCKKRRG